MTRPVEYVTGFEFDCVECGRHIILIAGPKPDPLLCGCCLHMPGWFEVPEIRDLVDPTYAKEMGDGRL